MKKANFLELNRMKICLIYHSGTGTTAKYADQIAQGFEEFDHTVIQYRVNSVTDEDLEGYDLIGVGTPTYAFRAPHFIIKKINTFPEKEQPYFLFNTCAGSPGNTFSRMYKALKKKNWILLVTIFSKRQETTNIQSWRPKLEESPPEKDGLADEEFERARNFASSVLESYQEIIIDKTKQPLRIRTKLLPAITILLKDKWLAKVIIGKKSVDLEKCTKCGFCATKICPTGCISMDSDNLPTFNEKLCISSRLDE